MILDLTLLRNAGLSLLTAGTVPMLRFLLGIVLPLAPASDFQPPMHLHAQYDFIVGECACDFSTREECRYLFGDDIIKKEERTFQRLFLFSHKNDSYD